MIRDGDIYLATLSWPDSIQSLGLLSLVLPHAHCQGQQLPDAFAQVISSSPLEREKRPRSPTPHSPSHPLTPRLEQGKQERDQFGFSRPPSRQMHTQAHPPCLRPRARHARLSVPRGARLSEARTPRCIPDTRFQVIFQLPIST